MSVHSYDSMFKVRSNDNTFIKNLVAGVFSTASYALCAYVFIDIMHLTAWITTLVFTVILFLLRYFINKNWVFK